LSSQSTENISDLFQDVKRFFTQQADLYGEEFSFAATKTAPEPETLESLQLKTSRCKKCALAISRNQVVFGAGNPAAEIMVVGEAPGEAEDAQGIPFVGQAGDLLTKILIAIQFSRQDVYITNILKCRPPQNRDPEATEMSACVGYLWKQIDIIKQRLILALGLFAGQTLLSTKAPLSALRGKIHEKNGIYIVVTYHPAALLRNAEWKRPTWEDVQLLRRKYDELTRTNR